MTNRYAKEIEKIKISDNMQNKILKKYGLRKKKVFLIPLVLLICLSMTIVNAEAIKEKIVSLGKALGGKEIKTTQKEIYLDEIHTLETNVDNLIIDKQETKESNNIKEIENIIGVDLLDFKNKKFLYSYYSDNDTNKIATINIETRYNLNCNQDCDVLKNVGNKVILITAKIYTSNYTGNIEDETYQKTKTSTTFSKFLEMNINGIAYGGYVNNDDKSNSYLDIEFNYNNISYHISSWNMTFKEVHEFLYDKLTH